jgi:glycine dehydrogenase subunit 1
MATYIGRSENERQEMLRTIGVRAMEDLLISVPATLREKARIALQEGLSEFDMVASMSGIASDNASSRGVVCFAGAGVYDHFVPAAVRQLVSRSEFYTCYTPYQAEVSQGTLQAIFEFQSLMCRLTGMDVCNASLYDAATALAEAALLAVNVTQKKRVLVSACVHPSYRKVLNTYCTPTGITIEEIPSGGGVTDVAKLGNALKEGAACFIHQQPNFYGIVEDVSRLGELLSGNPALLVSCADPLSLSMLEPPGSYGADIVVGEGQVLGNAMNFGGPLLGFFASRAEYLRKLPGRIVGMTTDNSGRRGFVLTLQTREQHIRRAKATSNICTNEGLVALTATIYLALVGERGLKELASQCLAKSHYAAEKLASLKGFSLGFQRPFFKEFVLRCPVPAQALVDGAFSKGILAGVPFSRFSGDNKLLLVAVTEKRMKKEIDALCEALNEVARGLLSRGA